LHYTDIKRKETINIFFSYSLALARSNMFNRELLQNEIVRKIDCPGTHDHEEVSLADGSSKRSCVMIKKYMDLYADRIKEMKVYEDDVWVVTFPKCGTTWTQELVWYLK
jgi:hypothetical protein